MYELIGNINAPRALSARRRIQNGGVPRRERLLGGGQSPKGRILGSPNSTSDRKLPNQRNPLRPAVHLRSRPDQDGVRPDEHGAWIARQQNQQGDRPSVPRGDGRQT